nr:MAG TPA: hypothetical protein [Caudoviricetes sp.]
MQLPAGRRAVSAVGFRAAPLRPVKTAGLKREDFYPPKILI